MLSRIIRKIAPPSLLDPFEHDVYGKIYMPWYDLHHRMESDIPPIYNKKGEKMDIFFLRDRHTVQRPYMYPRAPSHWLWDRYNIGLKTHFYSHWEMLTTMGHPDRRYGMMLESDTIVPEDYRIFERHPGLEKDFDAIFTYNEQLLDKLDNAKFFPSCAVPLYGGYMGDLLDDTVCERKNKMVSICSSDKTMCDLHRYRLAVAWRCKREGLADTFGTFDGGVPVGLDETLTNYRYSITIENSLSRYFFTERLTSCFLAMTVPIYCGTPHIGDFFNTDGMIILQPGEDIGKALRVCSEKDYLSRLPAIQDNYRRALEYFNVWDWLYNHYLKIFGGDGDKVNMA